MPTQRQPAPQPGLYVFGTLVLNVGGLTALLPAVREHATPAPAIELGGPNSHVFFLRKIFDIFLLGIFL